MKHDIVITAQGHKGTMERLGILGLGRIGEAIAKRAQAFGMTIRYHNRNNVGGFLRVKMLQRGTLSVFCGPTLLP
jgi:lactate dehydrogenase-like 2-hydroxyacid dehydrogenase